MNPKTNYNITSRFLQIEEDYDVFDIKSEGVPIWERIRFSIHQKIKQKATDSGQAHTKTEFTKKAYAQGIKLWAKNLLYKNPYLSGNHRILFYGHSRRKMGADGLWEDIYCDPIYDESDIDYLHIEDTYLMDHKTPAKTKNLRYVDFIHYTGAIRRNLNLSNIKISGAARERLIEVNQALKTEFEVDVDIISRAETKLTRRDSILDLYRLFLQRVDPEVVVVVLSYAKHTFLEVCHELGIPTIELQHGAIHKNHLAYSFPGNRTKETFPDYLFTWGNYWNEVIEYPIQEERVINVGYPYLEHQRKQYESVESEDQILFISQGPIGKELSRFAMKVNKHPEIDENIVFKLHPGEYDRWQQEYPWLGDVDFDVIDSSEPPLYELFAKAKIQVGVSSTSIYEGLTFGLETYILNCTGSDELQVLIEEGTAILVNNIDEFVNSQKKSDIVFNKERYFTAKPVEKIHENVNKII